MTSQRASSVGASVLSGLSSNAASFGLSCVQSRLPFSSGPPFLVRCKCSV